MIKCIYCEEAEPLVIGDTNDKGIAIQYIGKRAHIVAYGYDVHGFGSNGLFEPINYCPMCGKDLREGE